MKLNTKPAPIRTHEGGVAKRINPEQQLRRSLVACMLWEKSFYEDGEDVADRIMLAVKLCKPTVAFNIAVDARTKFKIRHAPLLVARAMAKLSTHRHLVATLLAEIIQRPDELTEFLAIYWKDGKEPLSAQVKKGLARAFRKFDRYQLSKYNRDGAVKLRDVLFLCHAKPLDREQAVLWHELIDGKLTSPDTWEVALSSGEDKKSAWERLISNRKLGGMAILRNLRNMVSVGLSASTIREAISQIKTDRILPYRFISAAKHAPKFESELEGKMIDCLEGHNKFPGHTVLLIDVSASMKSSVSSKSDISRLDAACGLAMLLREVCDEVDIYTFSMALRQVPPRRGFALRDAIVNSQEHSGTPLGLAVRSIYASKEKTQSELGFRGYGVHRVDYCGQGLRPDRLIVITDEQSADAIPNPEHGKGYMINVASYKNGVGYGPWLHLDGWSEAIVSYIQEMESAKLT